LLQQAVCAQKAGRANQAIQICQTLLKKNNQDGLAYTILGWAAEADGDIEESKTYFKQAIQLTPNHPVTWLSLAELYQKTGQIMEMLETLQAASQTIPDRPEINLALGEAYRKNNSPTQALAEFRRATELAVGMQHFSIPFSAVDILNFNTSQSLHLPEEFQLEFNQDWRSPYKTANQLSNRITLRLGETLLELGHLNDSRQILEEAYQEFPNNSDLAYAYAQTLIKLKEPELALNPLQMVIDSGTNQPGPYLDSARCLIELLNNKPGNVKPDTTRASSLLDMQSKRNLILDKAIAFLNHALELNPLDAEAKTLLAELLSDRGDYEKALGLIGEAMDSEFARDVGWKNRLALDMSQVALKLKRGDLALTALLEADHSNLAIQQALAKAYQDLELVENAFKNAQTCLTLAPNDLENLVWFANFTKELKDHHQTILPQAQTASIAALQKAVELAPQRGDLWVALGELQMQTQDTESARQSFKHLAPDQHPGLILDCTNIDLYVAGKNLNLLGDPASAIVCLEEALQNKPGVVERKSQTASSPEPTLLDLLKELASTYQQAGHVEKALLTYDQALAIEPTDVGLHLSKTSLLLEASAQNDQVFNNQSFLTHAIESLEKAIERNPDQPQLLLFLGILHRTYGNLSLALKNINRLVHLLQNQPAGESGKSQANEPEPISLQAALAYAYELSCAMLQTEKAHQYLSDPHSGQEDFAFSSDPSLTPGGLAYPCILDYICQQAQIALENGNDPIGADILSRVLEFTINDPRVLALQARLNYHHGDSQAALSLLNSAMEIAQEDHPTTQPASCIEQSINKLAKNQFNTSIFRYIANAAKELSQWEMAYKCLEYVATIAPQEPQSYLDLARLVVERAEYQKLCQELGVLRHAPGVNSIEQKAYQRFQKSASALKEQLLNHPELASQEAESALKRWEIRGKAIFEPNPEHVRGFEELDGLPEDLAAKIACLRAVGYSSEAVQAAQSAPPHPLVLIQQAITLEADQPRQALTVAQLAAENLTPSEQTSASLKHPNDSIPASSIAPLIFALQARLIDQTGNRNGDAQTARAAIQKALEYWPDEPNWHTLAAEICQKNDPAGGFPDITAVIAHLEQAITFDPHNWQTHLALGKVFQSHKFTPQAIQILNQACQLAPEKVEIWHWLAKAYRDAKRFKDAKASLDRALELSPDDSRITLLRGEIAFQEQEYPDAAKLAQAALDQKPDDPGGLLLLVRALTGMGKSSEAQALLEKELPQTVDTIPLFLERARIVEHEKGIQAAVQALREVIERFPDHPAAIGQLAEFLAEAGNNKEALVAAQQALRVGHNLPNEFSFAEHARMHFLLGRLLREGGQLDQAIQHLTEAIHLAPDFVEPYLELGQTHLDRRQFQEALKAYNHAIEAVPQSSLAYYRAGLIFKECKDYINAEHMLRMAAKLAPEDLAIQRQLGAVVALNLVHNRKQQG
jgi:tetratricopeptide (TPR) repeat protein